MNQTPSGRYTPCPGGSTAFVPNPLPPKIEWSTQLINALSDADRLLGRLAGEGGKLPNPHIFIRPFIMREAVLSSRIEGTQSTLGEMLAKEAGAVVEQNVDDMREVSNYVAALEYGIVRLESLPLSLRLLRELHEKLMEGVRGQHATPGDFRRSQNWIGSAGCTPTTATYVPPPLDHMMSCLDALEHFFHDRTLPPLVQVALVHYQFEAIHPFLDGNGRVGRLLIILFLLERRILPNPFLYLSAFFEATRNDYYSGLLQVSKEGNWNNWLVYFLSGVARQAEDALSRAERINQLLTKWRSNTAGTSLPNQLIEHLAGNPFVTAKKIVETFHVAPATVQRAIDKLVKFGILSLEGDAKRNRVYCAKELLDILEEPANLVVMGKM